MILRWLGIDESLARIDFDPGSTQSNNYIREYSVVLDKLVETAYDPSIGVGHRGVAINAICSLIRSAAKLNIDTPFTKTTWLSSVDILLDRRDGAKSKPLRQLLLCLTGVLSTFRHEDRVELVDTVTRIIFEILLGRSDHVRAKPALNLLGHFITKEVLTIANLCKYADVARQNATTHMEDPSRQIDSSFPLRWNLELLLGWIPYQDTSIAASQAILILIDKISESRPPGPSEDDPMWVLPLLNALRASVDDLNDFRSHLLPGLFKAHKHDYASLLTLLGLEHYLNLAPIQPEVFTYSEQNAMILFTCLEVGKETGLVIETTETSIRLHDGILHIPEIMLVRILESAEDTIRLAGLALLISSTSVTRPFSPFVLHRLLRSLPNLLMETDVYVRGEVLVHFSRLIDRIKAASGPLDRNMSKTPGSETSVLTMEILSAHRQFMQSVIILAKAQLHPTAAYQRHIAGLRTLIILAKSGLDRRLPFDQLSKQAQAKEAAKWPFEERIFDTHLTRLLQDLLMDPFEDVRGFASTLLIMQASIPGLSIEIAHASFVKRAEALMLASGRADHADGVSRAYAIIFQADSHLKNNSEPVKGGKVAMVDSLLTRVEQRILLARDNMSLAVRQYPLHGALASLRYGALSKCCDTCLRGKQDDLRHSTLLQDATRRTA